jgi:hypothetical protein
MNSFGELKDTLVEKLKSDARLKDIRVVSEYPATGRDYPLTKPAIAVGIDSAELSAGLGGYLGGQDGLSGVPCAVTLRFDIFTPQQSGQGPHAIMEALCDIMLLGRGPGGIVKLWSDAVVFDATAAANRLTVRGSLVTALTADTAPAVPLTGLRVLVGGAEGTP